MLIVIVAGATILSGIGYLLIKQEPYNGQAGKRKRDTETVGVTQVVKPGSPLSKQLMNITGWQNLCGFACIASAINHQLVTNGLTLNTHHFYLNRLSIYLGLNKDLTIEEFRRLMDTYGPLEMQLITAPVLREIYAEYSMHSVPDIEMTDPQVSSLYVKPIKAFFKRCTPQQIAVLEMDSQYLQTINTQANATWIQALSKIPAHKRNKFIANIVGSKSAIEAKQQVRKFLLKNEMGNAVPNLFVANFLQPALSIFKKLNGVDLNSIKSFTDLRNKFNNDELIIEQQEVIEIAMQFPPNERQALFNCIKTIAQQNHLAPSACKEARVLFYNALGKYDSHNVYMARRYDMQTLARYFGFNATLFYNNNCPPLLDPLANVHDTKLSIYNDANGAMHWQRLPLPNEKIVTMPDGTSTVENGIAHSCVYELATHPFAPGALKQLQEDVKAKLETALPLNQAAAPLTFSANSEQPMLTQHQAKKQKVNGTDKNHRKATASSTKKRTVRSKKS